MACVHSAYAHYEQRIGCPPYPMMQNYQDVIRDSEVHVALLDNSLCGILVLSQGPEGFLLDNIAVNPNAQGKGIGKVLMGLAEQRARSAGFDSIYLYTNELMFENRSLYARLGYVEYDLRRENGLSRVYMRKALSH
ncbi:MAG: GNAT family N-acetyltransferase [Gammaproteobacteria bacterium HGW-Gammaproteobacteria-6]|nr:MAG: GNAT family N-acetyltransferase [Gammaproteobacteria bacterium HGW-Gammaproteobacteria-6]